MLNFIGLMFYGLAIADFLGMFFGYDFTGQSWTPLLFGAIGFGCQSLHGNTNQSVYGSNKSNIFTSGESAEVHSTRLNNLLILTIKIN